MTALRLQLGLLTFAALATTALINIFYFQPASSLRGQRLEIGPSPELNRNPPKVAALASEVPAQALPATDPAKTVRAIQRELEQRGYPTGTDDGTVGLVTRAAIMAYEFDHAMTLTGDATEDLLQTIVLGSANSEPASSGPMKIGPHAEQVIRTTQQSLAGMGYGQIKADGFLGDATTAAIRKFEKAQGLPETGRISGVMVARLAKLAALGQVQSGR